MSEEVAPIRSEDSARHGLVGWRSPWRQVMGRFFRNLSGVVGLFTLIVMTGMHLGAPLLTDRDPQELKASELLQSPSPEHPLGTDQLGRDLLSRVLYGGRISLFVAASVTLVTTITGVAFGALAGYYRRLDGLIMRAMDLLMAFPMELLAIGIVAVLGPQLLNVVLALIFPVTPRTARLVRGVVLSCKEQEFVMAARAIGAGDARILLRHLLPNVVPVLLVRQTFVFGVSILIEGGLNFLGIGVQPEIATLGSIVSDGRPFLRDKPWMSFPAGIAIALLVLGVNLLGDGIRDALDPKMKV